MSSKGTKFPTLLLIFRLFIYEKPCIRIFCMGKHHTLQVQNQEVNKTNLLFGLDLLKLNHTLTKNRFSSSVIEAQTALPESNQTSKTSGILCIFLCTRRLIRLYLCTDDVILQLLKFLFLNYYFYF